MDIDFSPASLFAGFVFGVIGLYMFRAAQKKGNLPLIAISVGLMVYPYFVSGAWLQWGLGCVLCAIAYYFRKG